MAFNLTCLESNPMGGSVFGIPSIQLSLTSDFHMVKYRCGWRKYDPI